MIFLFYTFQFVMIFMFFICITQNPTIKWCGISRWCFADVDFEQKLKRKIQGVSFLLNRKQYSIRIAQFLIILYLGANLLGWNAVLFNHLQN